MKKNSNFIIIAISIITICLPSCSKSKNSPPPPCSTPSTCIVNTWYLKQDQENYNGSLVTIFTKGSNSNLNNNLDSAFWVFASNNKWTGYASPSVIFDAGTWEILPDNKTVIIHSGVPDTLSIINISSNALSMSTTFNHNYPNSGAVVVAEESGLDTAKLNGDISTFGTTP